MTIKILRTDEGFRCWKGNNLVAQTDENGLLWAMFSDAEPVRLDYADSEREIRELLDQYGVA